MSNYGGANAKMSDVLRTVLVLAAGVLALFFIGRVFFTVEPDHPVSAVDYQEAASAVEPAAGFDPFVPERLPDGWISNSARIDAGTWEMGVVTDDDQFLGIRQLRDGEGEAYSRAVEDDGQQVSLQGREWRVGETRDEIVYALTDGDITTVVRSTASPEDTEDYVASLVPFSTLSPEAAASR
ncbi:DUF4245 domain-containing protein [Aeromicrobium camelliae]|uniref:DUF4245 domain-containing protein n=1 Tax=Aeromicrobium camelliae TaxID=1538144 RepID=A0A3N6Z7V1_9ACTN|nr:DUF4245 domain-containing protein [Aeromicrobium camelliae]RQN03027.1 DUF4245 domain-containing protein [Aeromicrobium camelliae]